MKNWFSSLPSFLAGALAGALARASVLARVYFFRAVQLVAGARKKIQSFDEKYNCSEVVYYIGFDKFRFLIPNRYIFNRVICITDLDDRECPDVFEYLGPNHDFHGTKLVPRMIGSERGVRLYFLSGAVLSYGIDDLIDPEKFTN